MSILPTYLNGYGGGWATLPTILARGDVRALDAEMRRRVTRMMRHARRSGVELGIGGAGRTTQQQADLFLARHTPDLNGSIWWNGQRWTLKSGMAPAAPPGRSYHETCAPWGALAVDMVGDLVWMNAHCGTFGLIHFGAGGPAPTMREPWHVQPVEMPIARAAYNANPGAYRLRKWMFPPLPKVTA